MARLVVGKVAFENTKEQHQETVLVKVEVSNEKKIRLLKSLLAQQIGRSAELLKENLKLEKKLEETQRQRDCWKNLYRKIKPEQKINCDRQKAMVVNGEIDVSEALGQETYRRGIIE